MKFTLSTIFLVLLFATAIFADAEVDESDVIVLDYTNFDEVVNKHPLLLVEFYAPWCGHCKRLVPEYAKAATELKDSNIFLAKINVDEESNKPIGNRMGIQGFPTLKVFTDGQATEYEGGRTSKEIVTYMKRQSLPAVSLLNSTEQIVQLFEDKVTSIVGFFKEEAGEAYQTFAAVAKTLKNTFPFSAVLNLPELAKQHGSHDDDHIVVWNAADGKKYTIHGDELKNLAASISKYGNPLLDEIGPHNFKNYMESGLPLAYVFLKLSEKEPILDQVREIAEETRGKINWVFIDNDKYARHGENLGLSGKTVPAIVLDDVANGFHYVYDETATIAKDLVKSWSDKFLSGELKPNVKSEEIPENNNGPVKIVVQKSFKDIVLDEEKAVLVEFYAPWCGHCKTLAPIYEEVGSAFISVPDVIIAKMDATANDVDKKYEVRGYPTLKFFPKGSDKTPVDYEGNRSKQDLIDFLNKQTGNNVDSGSTDEDEKDEL